MENSWGLYLRELASRNHLSMRTVAQSAGISYSYLMNLISENRRAIPSDRVLASLASALNLDPDEQRHLRDLRDASHQAKDGVDTSAIRSSASEREQRILGMLRELDPAMQDYCEAVIALARNVFGRGRLPRLDLEAMLEHVQVLSDERLIATNNNLALALQSHGDALHRLRKFDSAIEAFEQSYRVFEQTENYGGQAATGTRLAAVLADRATEANQRLPDRRADLHRALALFSHVQGLYERHGETFSELVRERQLDNLANWTRAVEATADLATNAVTQLEYRDEAAHIRQQAVHALDDWEAYIRMRPEGGDPEHDRNQMLAELHHRRAFVRLGLVRSLCQQLDSGPSLANSAAAPCASALADLAANRRLRRQQIRVARGRALDASAIAENAPSAEAEIRVQQADAWVTRLVNRLVNAHREAGDAIQICWDPKDIYLGARWHYALAAELAKLVPENYDPARTRDLAGLITGLDGLVDVPTRRAAMRTISKALAQMDRERLVYMGPEGPER